MKMLTGLLPATEGRAELLGKPRRCARHLDQDADRLRLPIVFALRRMTVRGNLELHGRLCGIGRQGAG